MSLQRRVTEIFEQSASAVVRVKAVHLPEEKDFPTDANAQDNPVVRVGTGFFISREGLILVNASRVMGARQIVIEHQGTDYLATLIGADEHLNVALIKAAFLPDEFTFIRMNDTPNLPTPGTFAVGITCPFTFDPTPHLAMVVGHDTQFLRRPFPTTYLRVSQPLNMGEGGGPLIDLQGRLIGMLLASIQETNGSYALPARAISKIRDDLLLEGRVIHASVGVEVTQHAIRGGQTRVKVTQVKEDSPAHRAGIRPEDIVIRVGDYNINDFSDFPNSMFFVRVGEFVNFQVEREGELLDFNIQTVARGRDEEPSIRIEPLTRAQAMAVAEENQPASETGGKTADVEVPAPEIQAETTKNSIPVLVAPRFDGEVKEVGPSPQTR